MQKESTFERFDLEEFMDESFDLQSSDEKTTGEGREKK